MDPKNTGDGILNATTEHVSVQPFDRSTFTLSVTVTLPDAFFPHGLESGCLVLSPERIALVRAALLVAVEDVDRMYDQPMSFAMTTEWGNGYYQTHTEAGDEAYPATSCGAPEGVRRCLCSLSMG